MASPGPAPPDEAANGTAPAHPFAPAEPDEGADTPAPATALSRLSTIFAVTAGLILLSVVMVTTVNAAAFALDRAARLVGATVSGLPGYEDYVRLALSAAVPMCLPWCQIRRGHVAVDFLVARLPAGLRHGFEALWLFATAALALFLAYWMSFGLLQTRADHALSRVLGWPEWPFYAPGIAALVLWGVVCGHQLVRHFRHRSDRRHDRA